MLSLNTHFLWKNKIQFSISILPPVDRDSLIIKDSKDITLLQPCNLSLSLTLFHPLLSSKSLSNLAIHLTYAILPAVLSPSFIHLFVFSSIQWYLIHIFAQNSLIYFSVSVPQFSILLSRISNINISLSLFFLVPTLSSMLLSLYTHLHILSFFPHSQVHR